MLISDAIRSRTNAVGVGFLLNSTSRVMSWSWVARCRFWFFCCCVSVLFRGGRRALELFELVFVFALPLLLDEDMEEGDAVLNFRSCCDEDRCACWPGAITSAILLFLCATINDIASKSCLVVAQPQMGYDRMGGGDGGAGGGGGETRQGQSMDPGGGIRRDKGMNGSCNMLSAAS